MPPEPVPNVAFWIDGPDGIPIADVKNHAPERTLADARLIVAAPHLLEMCQELSLKFESTDCPFTVKVARESIHRAWAVIARATGETV